MTTRWILSDPDTGDSWTMPINPDSALPVSTEIRAYSTASSNRDGHTRVFAGKPRDNDWGWSGVIRTKAHYDQLLAWSERDTAITVTDHLGRTLRVFITKFDPTDRPPTGRVNWRLRYSISCKLLHWSMPPV